jgi:hypothetical protein
MTKKHTKNFNKLRNKILIENSMIEIAIETQKLRLRKLQELCDHKGTVVMSPFKSGIMFDHHEFRLCAACGIQESGWNPKHMHPGYGKDITEVQTDLDTIYALRTEIRGRTGVNIVDDGET